VRSSSDLDGDFFARGLCRRLGRRRSSWWRWRARCCLYAV